MMERLATARNNKKALMLMMRQAGACDGETARPLASTPVPMPVAIAVRVSRRYQGREGAGSRQRVALSRNGTS